MNEKTIRSPQTGDCASASAYVPERESSVYPDRQESAIDAVSVPESEAQKPTAKEKIEFKSGHLLIQEALSAQAAAHGKKHVTFRTALSHLPSDVRRRRELLEESLSRETGLNENGTHTDLGADPAADPEIADGPLYYRKAQTFTGRNPKLDSELKKKMRRNLRIFLIIALCFGLYYLFIVYTRDDLSLSLKSLEAQLPYRLDAHTVLTKITYTAKVFHLELEKEPTAMRGLNPSQIEERLDLMGEKAQSAMCKKPALSKIISSGRQLRVSLHATDGSYNRDIIVTGCSMD